MPRGQAVERVRSDVRVELGERVARYEIAETFVNRGNAIGEADYLLPLPRNAAFRELRLFIDGEPVGGEIMDANRARAIYEEIVRAQRDPALVEWMGHGLLRARIFPIAPGERKEIEPTAAPASALSLRPAERVPPRIMRYDAGNGVVVELREYVAAHLRDAAPRAAPAAQVGTTEQALANQYRWTDPAGTRVYVLSGPFPIAELEEIARRLAELPVVR